MNQNNTMPRLDTLATELVERIARHLLGEQQKSHQSEDLQALRLACRQLERDTFKVWTSSYSLVYFNDQDDIDDTAKLLSRSSKVIETLDEVILSHADQLYGSKVRQILATVPKLQKLHMSFDHDLRNPAKFDVLPGATTLELTPHTISKAALKCFLQRTKCRKLILMVNKCFKDIFQVLLDAQLETLEAGMTACSLPDDLPPLPERLRGPEGMNSRVQHSKYRLQCWKMKGFRLWGHGPEMVKAMIERVLEIYESEPAKDIVKGKGRSEGKGKSGGKGKGKGKGKDRRKSRGRGRGKGKGAK